MLTKIGLWHVGAGNSTLWFSGTRKFVCFLDFYFMSFEVHAFQHMLQ